MAWRKRWRLAVQHSRPVHACTRVSFCLAARLNSRNRGGDRATPGTLSGTGESGEPFIPPMDPALELDPRGKPRILGGFGLSSLDDVAVEESASDQGLGDEALADAVRRELREDATTTALNIDVEVWDRV